MSSFGKLIDQLIISVQQLNPAPLRDSLPESKDQYAVLEWLYENLSEQKLMVYEEWKEYTGWIPEIKLLADLPLSDVDTGFMFELLEKMGDSDCEVDYSELLYGMPYLEFINHHLKMHQLRLVDLLPFENAYIFCVNDDDEQIASLDECLKQAGIRLNPREPMDKQQAIAHISQLLKGG
jgi:hypothetical protein